ncbi:MAG TPA: sugar-transfer associated ATP-grasp domain-containing protein [Candidatus Limnocylindria bacterium]|nr:sugar-transfer associated ATP-grasp domain-containing protein [Candidatus Limnocylindria bacterium]
MQGIREQKEGPPPEPGFRPAALAEGWRGVAELPGLGVWERLRAMAEYVRLSASRGVTPYEHFKQYRFFEMPRAEQEEFLTFSEAQRITWRLSREIRDVFWHKDLFNRAFGAFIRRDWMKPAPGGEEEFRELCRRHPQLIVKPSASTEGRGIRILETGNGADTDALLRALAEEDAIVEEVLKNDERLAAFNPDSLNTVRVVTLYDGARFEVYGAAIRFGRRGAAVDNVSSGGLHATLDPATGKVVTHGKDASGNSVAAHPDSGMPFLGFRVPRWEEVLELARAAVDVLPRTRIAGWDVALPIDREAALVEGNHMPDFGLLQYRGAKGIKRDFEAKVRAMFGERFLDGRGKGAGR